MKTKFSGKRIRNRFSNLANNVLINEIEINSNKYTKCEVIETCRLHYAVFPI